MCDVMAVLCRGKKVKLKSLRKFSLEHSLQVKSSQPATLISAIDYTSH